MFWCVGWDVLEEICLPFGNRTQPRSRLLCHQDTPPNLAPKVTTFVGYRPTVDLSSCSAIRFGTTAKDSAPGGAGSMAKDEQAVRRRRSKKSQMQSTLWSSPLPVRPPASVRAPGDLNL